MTYENIKLTLGTLATVLIGFITILFEKYLQTIEASDIQQLLSFLLIFLTVAITVSTAFLYFRSRQLFDGFNYFLCLLIGLLHLVALPLGIVAILKIEFGQYWLGVVGLAVAIIFFANSNKDDGNKTYEITDEKE
ncbi:hypothetical protein FZW96_12105 [Bacillus sp. BGMRC 2118]|nr:hypothetical protein FZW96_12105 [Bacillus sp. BGMRC 2118]